MATNSKKGLGLAQGNKNSHIFTEFEQLNKEATQLQVLEAIKGINISAEIGSITVESSDTTTHTKLDTIDNSITNKHLDSSTDSVLLYGSNESSKIAIQTNTSGHLDIVGNVNANCSGSIESKTFDGAGGAITSTEISSKVGLDVHLINESIPVTGTFYPTIQEIGGSDYGVPTAVVNPLYVDANGFITANVATTTHENIQIGFVNNIANMTILTTPSENTDWNQRNRIAQNQDGFNYENITSLGSSSGSLLWYNNGPYGSIVTFPPQDDIEFRNLDTFYVILANYQPSNQSHIKMNIYSKAVSPTNYTSKWSYKIHSGQFIGYGQSYMLYNGNLARIKNNDIEVPRILYDYDSTESSGPLDNTEIISHIELVFENIGGIKHHACVIEGGLYIKQIGLLNYYFTNELVSQSYDNIALMAPKVNTLSFDNDDNLLCATKITNGTNIVDVQQNTTSTTVNLKDKYGLVSDSVLYAKTGTDIKNVVIDSSGHLDIVGSVSATISGSASSIKIGDGTNNAEIIQNTTTSEVNLKDKYGVVTDSVLYGKNSSGDIKNVTIDSSGNLNVNLASGTVSIGSVNIKDSDGHNLNAVSDTIPQLRTSLYEVGGSSITSSPYTFYTASKVALDVAVVNDSTHPVNVTNSFSYVGNLYNVMNNVNLLVGGYNATAFNCSDYGANSVISYSDTNISMYNRIYLYAYNEYPTAFGNAFCIGILEPIYYPSLNKRIATATINLAPFKSLYIYSPDSATNNIYVSLVY